MLAASSYAVAARSLSGSGTGRGCIDHASQTGIYSRPSLEAPIPKYVKRLVATALAVTAALLMPLTASSANVAPNAGFETDCSGIPCQWSLPGGNSVYGSIARDTATKRTASASLQLSLHNYFSTLAVASSCIAGITQGNYNASAWYRLVGGFSYGDAMIDAVFWSSAGCTSGSTLYRYSVPALANGSWNQLATTFTAPAGTQAVQVRLDYYCPFCNSGGSATYRVINYDDVVFEPSTPTSVVVESFRTERAHAGVRLVWRAGPGASLLGFNLYRQQRGKLVKLNRALIPSVFGGTAKSHAYSWLDRRAPRGSGKLRYRLQAVSLDGSRSWVGAATVAR